MQQLLDEEEALNKHALTAYYPLEKDAPIHSLTLNYPLK